MLECLRWMTMIRVFDDRMLKLQRQGRIGFVGTATGLEASIIGSAAAFEERDWVFPALRESGAALMRGMPLTELVAQQFGNVLDTSKGRQMPSHPQHRGSNWMSWSSCIGTQLTHAVGVAWGMKRDEGGAVACAYMGDGASSSTSFHSAATFAGAWNLPVVFVLIDNGWAISVPSAAQSAARSYGSKAKAYGFPGVDVDGNDLEAVYEATRAAVDRARAGDGPSLVALKSYRMLGHSSSDDPTKYRDEEEVEAWGRRDPISLLVRNLTDNGVWDEGRQEQMAEEMAGELAEAVEQAEAADAPSLESIFEDTLESPPPSLEEQRAALLGLRDSRGETDSEVGAFPL